METKFEKWQGDYEKDFYEVRLDGTIVQCWPNAGNMHALDGSGRQFKPGEVEVRRVQDDFPQGEDKCTFWHKWSKWKDERNVDIRRQEKRVMEILVQKKVCKKCGEKRYRQEVIWDANELS